MTLHVMCLVLWAAVSLTGLVLTSFARYRMPPSYRFILQAVAPCLRLISHCYVTLRRRWELHCVFWPLFSNSELGIPIPCNIAFCANRQLERHDGVSVCCHALFEVLVYEILSNAIVSKTRGITAIFSQSIVCGSTPLETKEMLHVIVL